MKLGVFCILAITALLGIVYTIIYVGNKDDE